MLLGSLRPSPLPSWPEVAQVEGMNCIGPTARSCVESPSYAPLSVSGMLAKPTPLRTGPRIGGVEVPAASTAPPRAWPDSTLPMAASSCQGSRQSGRVSARACSAFL